MATVEDRTPPRRPSDEAEPEELQLASKQGHVYGVALEHMVKKVAHDGGEQKAGDYLVAYAVEEAEGMYVPEGPDGALEWHDPGPDENCHIEIAVRDRADGRFIPGLQVELTVVGPDGTEVGTATQPFIWHPWLWHYGRNWGVPGDGEYTFRVTIEPPSFHRHDRENGRRYERREQLELTGVKIATGRKA